MNPYKEKSTWIRQSNILIAFNHRLYCYTTPKTLFHTFPKKLCEVSTALGTTPDFNSSSVEKHCVKVLTDQAKAWYTSGKIPYHKKLTMQLKDFEEKKIFKKDTIRRLVQNALANFIQMNQKTARTEHFLNIFEKKILATLQATTPESCGNDLQKFQNRVQRLYAKLQVVVGMKGESQLLDAKVQNCHPETRSLLLA